ncbi:hypothetical protein BDZ89DRAFT_609493 [Hymenopellis radicata]|nr:hypothetical protein BDZ89DRAFT_609493 [Hymenopellis radicata]
MSGVKFPKRTFQLRTAKATLLPPTFAVKSDVTRIERSIPSSTNALKMSLSASLKIYGTKPPSSRNTLFCSKCHACTAKWHVLSLASPTVSSPFQRALSVEAKLPTGPKYSRPNASW